MLVELALILLAVLVVGLAILLIVALSHGLVAAASYAEAHLPWSNALRTICAVWGGARTRGLPLADVCRSVLVNATVARPG